MPMRTGCRGRRRVQDGADLDSPRRTRPTSLRPRQWGGIPYSGGLLKDGHSAIGV